MPNKSESSHTAICALPVNVIGIIPAITFVSAITINDAMIGTTGIQLLVSLQLKYILGTGTVFTNETTPTRYPQQ